MIYALPYVVKQAWSYPLSSWFVLRMMHHIQWRSKVLPGPGAGLLGEQTNIFLSKTFL